MLNLRSVFGTASENYDLNLYLNEARTPNTQPSGSRTPTMTYQTTMGWSLVTSGIVTLLLAVLPGDSVWWGVLLLVAGIGTLYVRQ